MDQILDILTEPLDVDTDVRNIDDLDPDDAAAAIVEYLRGIWSTEHLSDEEIRELTEARGDKSDLREIFAKNIREYQEALESRDENPDFNLLTRTDYRDLRLQLSFGNKLTENKDVFYSVLKNEAHEYLSRNLVGDFKSCSRILTAVSGPGHSTDTHLRGSHDLQRTERAAPGPHL